MLVWSILLREGNFFEMVTNATTKSNFAAFVRPRLWGSHRFQRQRKTHKINKDTHAEEKCVLTSTRAVSQAGLGVWKATRSVWHWLFCANSTLGDALASFAANPGKEITDTHNAAFCLSAKKKTNPLSLYKRRYRHSHSLSPCPRSKPRLSFISRNMPSNMCLCSVARSLKAP